MLPSANPAPPPVFREGRKPGYLVVTADLPVLRTSCQQSLVAVSQRTGISRPALHRLEHAAGPLTEDQARTLYGQYGITTADECWGLAESLAQDEVIDCLPNPVRRAAAVERAATHMRVFTSHAVPPIVQTAEYARALADLWPQKNRAVLEHADTRRLTDDDPRSVLVILEEGVLRRRMKDAQVLAPQWAHLQVLMDRRQAEVRILPFTSPWCLPTPHVAELVLHGRADSYLYADFHGPNLVIYTRSSEVHERFTEMQAGALSAEESYSLLGQARKEAATW
ncbi:hypothetical protein GCM10018793_61760 [Streptomyces sulfonofaciens]|uniref:DUF5753 domain-containing protein n=1 Tax=Streptomyces sulfonofaciens TaxID=68272 RepID=A0A919L903_9ACTN|nr:Scr1 family TA system antitoxin-like transcriptional regulator [Streptomyces sulfonofaciens]GHH87131.1 hypothetical protein GCM10018793_61760 [Streptomyces sulfonofaciens]